jgi:hypothetical protein
MDPIKRLYGVYRGVVKNNNDPESQRRLQVQVQTTGNEITDWAWPMEPSSIHTQVPVIGQGVWVTYLGGDPEYPVWFGAFGRNQGNNKVIFVKPLDNSIVVTSLTPYLKINDMPDGTKEVDLTDTLLLMANKLKNHEERITSLEQQMPGKADITHSHGV